MKITLHPPHGFSILGKRTNNEDRIYPTIGRHQHSNPENPVFLVCDGVGGASKGEIASKIVCDTFSKYHLTKDIIREHEIDECVWLAEQEIRRYQEQKEEARGMATTLTFLSFHNDGATVAHMGDSRVYQIRKGQIIYKTIDHSFVNELVAQQIIDEEEAKRHPQKNVITKTVKSDDEHHKPEVIYLSDVQESDYFFLCTDGVLESVSDDQLLETLSISDIPTGDKMNLLRGLCEENSTDNSSAYLVQIATVNNGDHHTNITTKIEEPIPNKKKFPTYKILLGILFSVLCIYAFLFFTKTNQHLTKQKLEEEMRQKQLENTMLRLDVIEKQSLRKLKESKIFQENRIDSISSQ